MFCPLKLYFQSNIDEDVEEDYFISKTLKDLRIDIQDILHKNLRHIKKDMDENEIEKRLSIGISNQVKTTFDIIEEVNEENRNQENEDGNTPSNLKNDDEIEFIDENNGEIKTEEDEEILSLKVAQSMKVLDKDGSEIQNLFFPTSMYNYLIRDIGLDLIGVIDKIEVEKGNYFPISLKSSNPPVNGVWDGDFMEAIANALLIEQEFNTYVTVAYVDYLKIADRRAVIIDTDARKSFFKVLTSVNKIVENGEIPTVKTGLKKDEEIEFIDEEKKEDENDNLKELKKELINEINLNIKILSLKLAQSMKVLDKDGSEIQNLFFPTCMYNYLIRDIGLDLIGVIDKIEVEKGNYFPISLKSSNPPINGVWDGDFMEAIANALLIEQEFNTYVTVAYIDYLKIADRRAVIIDTDARKSFFKVLTSVNKIVENGEIPTVKTGLKKCENCEYKELCDNS